ncbi:MAG: helix-turn-helix transcriptional regulator [Acidobacteria bacterium]|nr:helix-turn-helix transcriptional regulator [Acidobacteriota bacterium]
MWIFAGQQLRHLRERLGLTLRDVETASSEIAGRHANQEFFIPFSRLSEIETKGVLPSIFRIYSLAAIYRTDYRKICALYNVKLDGISDDSNIAQIPKTHRFGNIPYVDNLTLPTAVDPSLDVRRTTNLTRMIQRWGLIPLQFVEGLKRGKHTYAFVGTEDFTMYPLLMPGSFLQVDETRTHVVKEGWRSEYERPIYFVETREEFFCSWCNISDDKQLIVQPHPLSPVAPRIFRHPEEAEVLGQVVGLAMRLNEWKPADRRSADVRPAEAS